MGCKGGCGKTGWKPQKTKDLQPIQAESFPICENCEAVDIWFQANTYPTNQEFLSGAFFTLFEDFYFACWIEFVKSYSGCENARCGLIIQALDTIWTLIDGFYMRRKDILFRISDTSSSLFPACENDLLIEWNDPVAGWLSIRVNCVPKEQGDCFPTVNKNLCQMGCAIPVTGCCCDCMATCDDLVFAVNNMTTAICCLASKLDCLIEIQGQTGMDRQFVAQHFKNLERNILIAGEQTAQAIIASGQALARTQIPFYDAGQTPISDPDQNSPVGCGGIVPDPCQVVDCYRPSGG